MPATSDLLSEVTRLRQGRLRPLADGGPAAGAGGDEGLLGEGAAVYDAHLTSRRRPHQCFGTTTLL
jgi:hypothetical protein